MFNILELLFKAAVSNTSPESRVQSLRDLFEAASDMLERYLYVAKLDASQFSK